MQIELENELGQSKITWTLSWVDVGAVGDFVPGGGAAVLVSKSQLAVYNVADKWFCCQNFSPKNRTFAMSRGIVGDKKGVPSVADPVHKTVFSLATGECINEPGEFSVLTFRAKEKSGRVLLELPAAAELDEVLSTRKNEIKFEEASSEKSGGLIKKLDDQDFKEKGTAFPEAMKAPDGCCGGSSSGEIEYEEASSCCGGNKSVADW